MRLPHHPEAVEALRTPTVDAPWTVLVSGCLAGLPCGVEGTDYGLGAAQPEWFFDPRVRCVSFCPEDHFLYPEGNTACGNAVAQYSQCLSDDTSFQGWTLERLVSCLETHSSAQWIHDAHSRYLDFSRLQTTTR